MNKKTYVVDASGLRYSGWSNLEKDNEYMSLHWGSL